MIRLFILYVFVLALSVGTVKAQYSTGSDDLNRNLIKIDAEASVNFGAFKSDLIGSYDITNGEIDYLSVKLGMSAGDIYMTVRIAKITSVDIEKVVDVYQVHRRKGWGVMAKELGIKPGSPEFHALKGSKNKKAKGSTKSNNPKGKKG
ncbi:MAG: hypothetical protein OER04_19275 [Cyclobacteriaceae bacterium]|nr:hypothetical protein [Cyclobacteriaceae bacterium]